VMFNDPKMTLEDAMIALRKRGLNVTIHPESLIISDRQTPGLAVILVRNPYVLETARALGAGTDHATALNECDARFEITMTDVEQTLKEPKTIEQAVQALQQLTRGVAYRTWDKVLAGPQ